MNATVYEEALDAPEPFKVEEGFLNGREGAFFVEFGEDDDEICFETAETLAQWIRDLHRAAEAAGVRTGLERS